MDHEVAAVEDATEVGAHASSERFLESIARDVATAFIRNPTWPTSQPWLDDRAHQWNTCRTRVAKVLLSGYTEFAVNLIILLNFGLIIYEVDQEAQCYPKFASNLGACPSYHNNISWLAAANIVLLAAYSIEAITRIYVLRRTYFESKLHLFELALCVVSWLVLVINSDDTVRISWLRIFRCCRIVHAARLATRIPEGQVLFAGFMDCMRAMLFGMLIILALLCFFSIFAVHFVHPISSQIEYDKCNRCSKGFQSISSSMLTLYQQIVAGDSWGAISIPVLEKNGIGLMLPLFQIVIGLGAMNLILAAIVDQAMEARGQSRAKIAQMKAAEHKSRKLQLLDLVRMMDVDNSGSLDRDEILNGIQKNHELQTRIALCGLRKGEIEKIVNALTSPVTQTIGYKNFSNVLDDLDAADIRKTAVLTKVMISGMQRQMIDRFDKQSEKITAIARGIEQLSDRHPADSHVGNTVGTHAQALAENVKQERSAASTLWQHKCPHSISTDDLDFRLGKSITDAMLSCRAEIDSQSSHVQQSLRDLDTRWSACMRGLEDTLHACANSNAAYVFSARFLDHATRTHQTLERRRHNLFENVMNAIEDDFGFWVCQCSFLDASDNVHAEQERNQYEELIHSPRSPLERRLSM